MTSQPKRELISTSVPDGKSEVSSDGRTVWVNKEMCLARFCLLSHEYGAVRAEDSANGFEYRELTVPHNTTALQIVDHWGNFVVGVKLRWGVEIGPEHTPLYV
jgi:hypothetical protein